MNSEISKLSDANWLRGWVLYDGACPLCCRWAVRFEPTLTRRGFDLAPLQAPWVRECLGLPEAGLLSAMRLLTPDGIDRAGADALLFLARYIWWAWPVYLLGIIPGARPILRYAYERFARHRHCAPGACQYVAPSKTSSDRHHGLV